ncbi:FtsX-like permease family protein [Dactylosporangium sp. NPDC049742]|uniref:FtsX-like permease family protein n=1 Tax=Dactylosporangium sp. NPDC049742 TaxID=3154737 RepID=UPI00343AA3A0
MARGGWLSLAPWRRAPLLLLRRPSVAVAVAVATAVAVLPAAAGPLFLSSAGSATLRARTASVCPAALGSQVIAPERPVDPGVLAAAVTQEAEAAADGLGDPAVTLVSAGVAVGDNRVNIAGRSGFEGHVQRIAGGPGHGLWLPDRFAAEHGLRPGDTLTISPNVEAWTADGRRQVWQPTAVPVVAIYRDLRDRSGDDPFWCGISTLYRGDPAQQAGGLGSDVPVLDLLLADRATMLAVASGAHIQTAQRIERAPATIDLTAPEATRLAAGITGMHDRLRTTAYDGRILYRTALPPLAGRAALVERELRGTVLPISAGGLLVGLSVVMAAGAFWVRRRERELVVLATFGATARWLGVKAALEALPALAAGAAGGWALAWLLVAQVGPSSDVSGAALVQSLIAAVSGFLVATAVLGVTAGVACRPLTGAPTPRARVRRRLAAAPWELLLLAAAAGYWSTGGDRSMVRLGSQYGTMVQIPAKLLVVPMLAILCLCVVGARLATAAVRRRTRTTTAARSAVRLLYRRRLRHSAAAAVTLALITAVPVAVAVYGATATGTVSATLAAQARLGAGSDVVITLAEPGAVPAALAGRATPVLRLDYVQLDDQQVSLLAVDPATFARDAYWDDRLDDTTLAEATRALRAPPAGGLAAVASAPVPDGVATMTFGGDAPVELDVTSLAALPAPRGGYPVLLVDRAALGEEALARAVPQLWVRGDPAPIRAAVDAAGLRVAVFSVADDRHASTFYQPVTYTFAYLSALSLLTATVAMVGFLLYLESRLRVLRRGYVMLRLMGLRSAVQGWLLLAEFAGSLVAGCAAGLGLAVTAAVTVRDQLNVDPAAAPGTVLSFPWSVMAGLLTAVGCFAVLVAAVTHWRLTRSRTSEVLRDID